MATAEQARPFGVLLQRHRVAAGLSQQELAERAGLSLRGISDLERGVRRAPHRGTTLSLAEALGLEPESTDLLLAAARGAWTVLRAAEPSRVGQHLPLAVTSLIGRDRDIPDVQSQL